MEIDKEEIPSLVNVGQSKRAISPMSSQLQDLSLSKVPLTIVTEFGDSADIEKALTVTKDGQESQEWLELGNGCLCCSIKDSGVNAIESLMERRGSFDYIILETSGLADPGNLAPLFWVDEGLGSSIYLDGIVTLVDAKNITFSLHEEPAESEEHEETDVGGPHLTTAHLQISHADVIVINKCDSVSPHELANVEARIRSINGLAKIHKTQYSQIPQLESFLLDLHAYDGIDNLDAASQGHSHLDPSISTTTLPLPPLSPQGLTVLETWLRSLLWENTIPSHPSPPPASYPSPPSITTNNPPTTPPIHPQIHRLKGLAYTPSGVQFMIQGVREVFEIVPLDQDGGSATKYPRNGSGDGMGKLVLIGRGIDAEALRGSLSGALGGLGGLGE